MRIGADCKGRGSAKRQAGQRDRWRVGGEDEPGGDGGLRDGGCFGGPPNGKPDGGVSSSCSIFGVGCQPPPTRVTISMTSPSWRAFVAYWGRGTSILLTSTANGGRGVRSAMTEATVAVARVSWRDPLSWMRMVICESGWDMVHHKGVRIIANMGRIVGLRREGVELFSLGLVDWDGCGGGSLAGASGWWRFGVVGVGVFYSLSGTRMRV